MGVSIEVVTVIVRLGKMHSGYGDKFSGVVTGCKCGVRAFRLTGMVMDSDDELTLRLAKEIFDEFNKELRVEKIIWERLRDGKFVDYVYTGVGLPKELLD